MINRLRSISWTGMMPLLLALFPLFIFWRGAAWETQQLTREREDQWLRTADRGARWLKKAGEASYWAELTARRFGTHSRRLLEERAPRSQPPSRALLQQVAREAAGRMHPAGMPQCRLWVLPLDPEIPGGRPALLSGPALADRPRHLMTSILDAVGEEWRGRASPLAQREWQNRMEHTFGFGVSGELFVPGYRGTSIPVVFNRAYGNLVWNVITWREKPVAIYILISPLLDVHQRRIARLLLQHYPRLVPKSPVYPVLLPLAPWNNERPPQLYAPKSRRVASSLVLARKLQHEIRIQNLPASPPDPMIDGLKVKTAQVPFYLYGEQIKGRVHLPVRRMNQVFRDDRDLWWSMLTPLPPRLGAVSLLIGDAPPRRLGVLEVTGFSWSFLCLVVLLVVAGEALWFRRSLTLGARASLLAWFFGLALIPLSLSIENSLQFVSDLRESLYDDLRYKLEQTVQSIEAGNNQIAEKTIAACDTFFKSHRTWNPDQFKTTLSGNPDALRRYVETHSQIPGFQLDGLFVYGGNDFEHSYIDPAVPAASKRLFSTALKNLLKTKLSLERSTGREPTTAEIMAANNMSWHIGDVS
ncbi:MAG TPA: hypothetical protein PKO06_10690, partial [Candidatus Ozemobacteraceae bacterium]|nr:hypothetical protein [Candidatus Ozemobacteraceae bacterium]